MKETYLKINKEEISVLIQLPLTLMILHKKNMQYYQVPQSRTVVRRLFNLLTSSASGSLIKSYVNQDFTVERIGIRMRDATAAALKELVDRVDPYIKDRFPAELRVDYGGDYERLKVGDVIIRGQIYSLLTTLAAIMLVLSIIFRSPLIGAMVTAPVAIAILFNFIVMWIFGVRLNPATAIIASVGMGVGVDYAIHLFSRFRLLFQASGDYRQSAADAIVESSRGILLNAAAVGVGFLVLLLSAYSIISQMGWIIALSMATTALASLTILPATIVIFRPKIKVVK